MSRRNQIALTPDEQRAYIATARTLTLCSNGAHGYPHAVAMWFAVDDDGTIWMTTYRKSQKAVNVARNPKVALHIESGDTYDTLRGVCIRGDAAIVDDLDAVVRTIMRVNEKMMSGMFEPGQGVEEAIRFQARKRIALKITPVRISSWDHAKLGGVY